MGVSTKKIGAASANYFEGDTAPSISGGEEFLVGEELFEHQIELVLKIGIMPPAMRE